VNLILGICVLIISTYFGTCFSKKYTERKVFYNDFNEFNNSVKNEINYSQNTIMTILSKNNEQKSDFYITTKSFFDKGDISFEKKYISKDEKNFFIDYLKTIGNGDRITQTKFVESASEQLKDKLKSAENDEKKYKKTYIKLGFLIGLISLIILL
jgi:hypothetical protein